MKILPTLSLDEWLSVKALGYLFMLFMDDFDGQEQLWLLARFHPQLEAVLHSVHEQLCAALDAGGAT